VQTSVRVSSESLGSADSAMAPKEEVATERCKLILFDPFWSLWSLWSFWSLLHAFSFSANMQPLSRSHRHFLVFFSKATPKFQCIVWSLGSARPKGTCMKALHILFG
jgi:hypothetical protein